MLTPAQAVSIHGQLVSPTSPALAANNLTICRASVPGAITLTGATAVSEGGRLHWPNLRLEYPLGKTAALKFECEISGRALPAVQHVELTMASCPPGTEPNAQSTSCTPCSGNTFSQGGLVSCLPCPAAGASCATGRLQLLDGFFPATSNISADDWLTPPLPQLYKCLNPSACVVKGNHTYSCAEGYTGALCAVCEESEGYARSSLGQCAECWPTWLNALLLTLLVAAACFALVYISLFKKHRSATSATILLRMLLSFIQLLNTILR